MFIDYQVTK